VCGGSDVVLAAEGGKDLFCALSVIECHETLSSLSGALIYAKKQKKMRSAFWSVSADMDAAPVFLWIHCTTFAVALYKFVGKYTYIHAGAMFKTGRQC
jgi:hypothetical protein